MQLNDHPTVQRARQRPTPTPSGPLDADWLKQLVLDAGADDVGLVELSRPALDDQRDHILRALPGTRLLISYVVRMNREAIRSTARSVANNEFHGSGDDVNDIGRRIVTQLQDRGIRALNPSMGFPMEMDQFPGRIWVVSHKPVAVAAGLGMMGIHRNVIHPRFGNFILLGTILVDVEVTAVDHPIDYNPCLECKLCVAACPVGAISTDGRFNFSACYTHNYREFMGGFTDFVEQIVDSPTRSAFSAKVSDCESASWWQSLSYGANYKAAYCLAVCPAGEDVIGPFLTNRSQFLSDVVRPLQDKPETLYINHNSDAEQHIAKRFPHKTVKYVGNGLRVTSVDGFLAGMPHVFQPRASGGLTATYHFTFTGAEQRLATVVIREQSISVTEGHHGTADLRIQADAATWVAFLRQEANIVWALLRRKIRLKGPIKLLVAFGSCFPK